MIQNEQPLVFLIQPDYGNWKPKDLENQKLMQIAHGFETDCDYTSLDSFNEVSISFTFISIQHNSNEYLS